MENLNFLTENRAIFSKMVRLNLTPYSAILHLKIIDLFSNLDLPKKMDKYSHVAETLSLSEDYVRKIIRLYRL